MSYKSLLSAAVIATVSAAPALADNLDFAGTLTGKYSNVNPSVSQSLNQWNLDGQAILGLGDGFSLQLNAGYVATETRSFDTDQWNLGGSVLYTESFGRVGANFGWSEASNTWDSYGQYNYGLFGEYFAADYLTVGAKAGMFSGKLDGHYFGANLTGYALPNLSFTGSVDHAQINRIAHDTIYTLQGEYLVSDDLPISFFAGYSYTQFTNYAGNQKTFFLGLRFFMNSNATTLVEHHRTGTVGALSNYGVSNIIYQ